MHPPERLSDIPPERAAALEAARRRALDFLSQSGYALVIPPLAEHWETLAVGGGDLSARTFQMTDTMSGRALGIRADHTPQIARLDAASGATGVRRWAYCGPTLRTRPDLPWRAREATQLGGELFGMETGEGDFEIARVAAGALKAAGVSELRADFGHAGIFNALTLGFGKPMMDQSSEQWADIRQAVCRRDAATFADLAEFNPDLIAVLSEMAEISGPAESAVRRARELLAESPRAGRTHRPQLTAMLDELENCVRRMTEAGWDAEIDLSELGGYSYHSGIVFAFYGEDYLAARGGRYNIPGSEKKRKRRRIQHGPARNCGAGKRGRVTDSGVSDLLQRIESPADVRALPLARLPELADDIRAFILDTIFRVGGHLSSNLGAVELAVALHRAYQTPHDRIVWDVGHQAYAHKILTGRRDQLQTVRQWGGISGFLSRAESPCDSFGAGHSSTAVSAAFGMAQAAKLKGENRKVAAVVGDGAMSGGMAFEALNNAGASHNTDLLVVLNDNEMSISPAVGALRNHLARILSSPAANSARIGGRLALSLLPPALEMAEEARKRIKGALTPGGLFQALGFNYVGPVDGHDVLALAEVLGNLRQRNGPQLLHVVTVKGKGFAEAEKDPVKFHGVAPLKVEKSPSARPAQPKPAPTYSRLFGEWLIAAAKRDPRVVAVTPAMLEGSGMTDFARQFPTRCFDAGIAEQHAVTFAAGMACEGMRPVVAIYSTFLQRGYDQLIHDAALQNLPVIFAIDRAGLVGADGATHQGAFDLSYLRCLPNITVIAPSDENEAWRALNTALSLPGPVAVRYPRGKERGRKPRGMTVFSPWEKAKSAGKEKNWRFWLLAAPSPPRARRRKNWTQPRRTCGLSSRWTTKWF